MNERRVRIARVKSEPRREKRVCNEGFTEDISIGLNEMEMEIEMCESVI